MPDISFFKYCQVLLEYYRNDEKVMSISGSNLYEHNSKVNRNSYYFGLGGIWGWATWKTAWDKYDFEMTKWSDPNVKKQVFKYLNTDEWIKFYFPMFQDTFNKIIDTWDVQWLFTIISDNGFSINPEVNLVRNIGFGINATHTHNSNNPIHFLDSSFISFPLIHPIYKKIDYEKIISVYNFIHSKKITNISFLKKMFLKFKFHF